MNQNENPNDSNPLVNDYEDILCGDRAHFLLSRIFAFMERIDNHIPEEERSGYNAIADYSELSWLITGMKMRIRELEGSW